MPTLSEALLITCCALAVLGLLRAERVGDVRLKYVCKPLASSCFVALGVARAAHGTALEPTALGVLLGLGLGALGDVCLMLPGSRWFLAGLVSFLLGHLAYTAAFASKAVYARPLLVVASTLAVVLGLMLRRVWSELGSKRWPVVAYAATIWFMVLSAAGVWLSGERGGRLVAAGAALFAVSDLAVLRERFVQRSFVNKLWGLPLYYGAQVLIALSLQ